MKHSFILILSLMSFACTASKILISGQVVDKSGIPISRAEVSTKPETDIVYTDRDGYFYLNRRLPKQPGETMSDIPAGFYEIRITKDGHEPLLINVNAKKGNVWANRHAMKTERALIDVTAPDSMGDPEQVPTSGGGPMIGQ